MEDNRISEFLQPSSARPETPTFEQGGFIAWPLPAWAGNAGAVCAWQQLVYQLALEQVKNQRPPLRLNYDSPAAWN
jgi:hypothetical protein